MRFRSQKRAFVRVDSQPESVRLILSAKAGNLSLTDNSVCFESSRKMRRTRAHLGEECHFGPRELNLLLVGKRGSLQRRGKSERQQQHQAARHVQQAARAPAAGTKRHSQVSCSPRRQRLVSLQSRVRASTFIRCSEYSGTGRARVRDPGCEKSEPTQLWVNPNLWVRRRTRQHSFASRGTAAGTAARVWDRCTPRGRGVGLGVPNFCVDMAAASCKLLPCSAAPVMRLRPQIRIAHFTPVSRSAPAGSMLFTCHEPRSDFGGNQPWMLIAECSLSRR